jgi:hypothetical protein
MIKRVGPKIKDGRRHNGGKRPGSGRKAGVPNKVGKDIRALARVYTAEAVETLVSIMRDKSAPPQARAMAADKLLDRGWGKPAQTIVGDTENPLQLKTKIEIVIVDPKADR